MKKLFGLLAIGGLIVIAAPAQHAQATTLINPGISAPAAAQVGSGVTEARYWRRHHRHWRWHRRWHRRHW